MKPFIIACLLASSIGLHANTLFSKKNQAILTACVSCHGKTGVSELAEIPIIAGQHPNYLIEQMQAYQRGTRQNAIMSTCLATLNDADIAMLATYYAKQSLPTGAASRTLAAAGERLYRGGNSASGVPACIACHGPKGMGNAQAGFAVLSGQHAAYTYAQLKAFKKGLRTDKLPIMTAVCAHMSTDEMKAVADYIQGLH